MTELERKKMEELEKLVRQQQSRAQGDARRDYLLQDVLPNLRGRGDGSVKKKVLSAVAEARKLGVPCDPFAQAGRHLPEHLLLLGTTQG